MAQCFVLGNSSHALPVAQLLTSSGVESRSFIMPQSDPRFLELCRNDAGLLVIGVFCKDFPNDAVDLLRMIRNMLPRVNVHALFEGVVGPKDTYNKLAHEVYTGFPLRSVDAASVLKRRWFPARPDTVPARASIVAQRGAQKKRPMPLPATIVEKDTPPKLVPPPTVPPGPVATVTRVVERVVPPKPALPLVPPKAEVAVEMDTLERVLTHIKKNSPLPKEPVRVDISGMTSNTSVELDPRRIKPLPDNPRWMTNPGFRPESLRSLGENMKTVGQAEKILVCPLIGNPDFDAQLVDGERRLRAAIMVGIMLEADIRAEITADMEREMYILSVVRNTEKEPHTTLEIVGMVKKFRGPEFGLTIAEVAKFFKKSNNWVVQHQMLGQLHPDVQMMLDEAPDGSRPERKLTSQLALLLYDIEKERQLSVATEILDRQMTYAQTRRHVLNVRRGLGLKDSAGGKNRSAQHFQALGTLTRRSIDAFGVFLDMPTAEMAAVLTPRTKGERHGLLEDLREFVENLEQLIKKVEIEE